MRPPVYRLSFLLPDGANIPDSGVHAPAQNGCALVVYAAGLVAISGRSREAVLDHAARFLRTACLGLGPTIVSMNMRVTGCRYSGIDSWHACVGADVAFTPSGLTPYLPPPVGARGPPELLSIDGGLA